MQAASAFTHIGVNVTDLDRSIAFYGRFGFKVMQRYVLTAAEVGELFALESFGSCQYAILGLEGAETTTRLDLVQFVSPASTPGSPSDPLAIGVTRICLRVPDLQAACAELRAAGVEFLSEPKSGGSGQLVVCKDPDGILVELLDTEVLKGIVP